jgi:hypothetical protein
MKSLYLGLLSRWVLLAAVLLLSLQCGAVTASMETSISGDTRAVHKHSSAAESRKTLVLPDKIIVGYANWNQCDEQLVTAVQQGVNVLIWFSVNLIANPDTGLPQVSGGPNRACVETIITRIRELNLPTIHLISIGGWNSPHPDTSNSAESVYESWKLWNQGTFDGFDWDIEGNDDMSSPYNHFTIQCLDLMGRMSQLAKKDGFIVTMAPAESYVDVTTSVFDVDLNHTYPEWATLQPNFAYHGHNVYAYLLTKFAKTQLTHPRSSMEPNDEVHVVDTFDFVMIQLYEGYSHAEYNTTILGQSSTDYIIKFVERVNAGWTIDFGEEYGGSVHISIPNTKLLVGTCLARLIFQLLLLNKLTSRLGKWMGWRWKISACISR